MICYVYFFFLPGSAGNFLSRCISLASDRCVGQIMVHSDSPYLSLEEKFRAFGYTDHKKYTDWIKFEKKLIHYSELFIHHSLITNSISIWNHHPDYNLLNKNIHGIDDKKFCFYIDPSAAFEWTILNALKKDSFIDKKWLMQGKKMLDDSDIVKIDLADIYTSHETFSKCVKKICNIVKIDLEQAHLTKIVSLWHQWIETTLMPNDFDKFKQDIGYFDT